MKDAETNSMGPRANIASGANWRDAYLCFCHEITAEDFKSEIHAAPDASFERICAEISLASKCTACLLNAETLYIETRREGTTGLADYRRRPSQRGEGWSRQRLYKILDALSPHAARKVPGIIPVIAGKGISTVLAFANTIPPVIGSRAPAFKIAAEIRDADGRVVAREKGQVEPGGRLEIEISRGLGDSRKNGEFATGVCFLSYQALWPGYLGSIRPHFKVITPVAATSVHSAGAGRLDSYVDTCLFNPGERQFMSIVNCTRTPARVELSVVTGAGPTALCVARIPARGARLVPIEGPVVSGGEPFGVMAKSDREVRCHYMVSEGSPPRVSLDHI